MSLKSKIYTKIRFGKYCFSLRAFETLINLGLLTKDALKAISEGCIDKAPDDISIPYYADCEKPLFYVIRGNTRDNTTLEFVCTTFPYLVIHNVETRCNQPNYSLPCTRCITLPFGINQTKFITRVIKGFGTSFSFSKVGVMVCPSCNTEFLSKETIGNLESEIYSKFENT
jgi:hypothetical protein